MFLLSEVLLGHRYEPAAPPHIHAPIRLSPAFVWSSLDAGDVAPFPSFSPNCRPPQTYAPIRMSHVCVCHTSLDVSGLMIPDSLNLLGMVLLHNLTVLSFGPASNTRAVLCCR